MKVFLLHQDRDFTVKPELRDAIFGAMASGDLFALTSVRRDLQRERNSGPVAAAPGNDSVLTQDLELQTLWNAMAAGDEFLYEVAKRAILSSLSDPDAVLYRQRVLADCLEHPETVRQLYELAIDALENERQVSPLWGLDRAALVLQPLARLQLHDPGPRRERLQGAGGNPREGDQPCRGRSRAVS